jgi:DNA-binding response OmpR family regulator
MKIMIIDDDADILNLFKDFLSKRGYDVVTFLDPLVAVKEIKNNPNHYALIITDIRMPGISGIELIKRVCRINSDIKVMIMSAFDINGDDLKEIRVEEQVQKPIHMRTLAQSIEKILKS